jgi:DNA-binding LytR/AlgR family response regulator
MRSMKLILSFAFLIFISFLATGQEVLSNWRLAKQSDDIKISYRDVKMGDNYLPINSDDIAYLISEEGLTFATLFTKERHIVNYSIVDLAKQMDPSSFFQINRKMIVNVKSVKKISSWFNSRLNIALSPSYEGDVVVSRERAGSFKEWLNL